jgi:hypothetical protein
VTPRTGRAAVAFGFLGLWLLALLLPRHLAAAEGRILSVPVDYPRIEDAIAASTAGDVILLDPGTYPGDVVIPEDKPGITIRGMDRNTVIFDGEDIRRNAIEVEADGVSLENMSAHNFVENGFYWDGVDGYTGRYLTVWNVGLYAFSSISSRDGMIEQSYASGAADAAFYIGECNPCNTTVRSVIAELSAVGYSGTNAGGNLIIEDSQFVNNGTGIMPNSFDVGLQAPPQRAATFLRNSVIGSGSAATPRSTPLGGYHGIGIAILGGVDDIVDDNDVVDSERYGIAVITAVDRSQNWVPEGNRVTTNRISGSGIADIALAAGSGAGNCFEGNDAPIVLPAGLAGCSAAGDGDAAVAGVLVRPPPDLLAGLPPAPAYASMPDPPAQPTMPVDLAPSDDAGSALGIELVGILATAAGIALAYMARPKNILDPKDRGDYGLRQKGIALLVIGMSGIILGGLLLLQASRAGPEPTPGPGARAETGQPIAWLN